MNKPSIAQLLSASGHTTYTPALITRAMYALYGNVGANLDGRDWLAIMQGQDPLALAEAGLVRMYTDPVYLVENIVHLTNAGYVPAQAEITYRQLAQRLEFEHNTNWSVGTAYPDLGSLSMDALIAQVPVTPVKPSTPTFTAKVIDGVVTFSGTATGTIEVSVDSNGTATFVLGGITTTVPSIAGKAIQLATGQTLALSAADVGDLAGVALKGAGTIKATEALSIAQLTALKSDSAWTGTLAYTAVADTAAHLNADGGLYAKNVAITISGAATLAELAAINSHKGTGSLVYTQVSDTAAELASNTDGFVSGAVNVTVLDVASVAQLAAIDALTTGTVSAQQLEDTVANLYPQGVLSAYVTAGVKVSLLDAASITQLMGIIDVVGNGNGSGNLDFTAIADTASKLLGYFVHGTAGLPVGTAVTVAGNNAGALSVAEVSSLTLITTDDTWTYSLKDKAENLISFDPTGDGHSASPAIKSGTNVVVTDAASVAQIALINSANGAGTLSYRLADTAENLTDTAAADTLAGATGTTVSAAATIAQINALLQISVLDASTVTYSLSDTAAHLLDTQNTATIQGATAITLAGDKADALTLEQVGTLRALTQTSNWTYSLADTLENLQAQGAADLIAGATGVTVTGNGGQGLTVAEVTALVTQLPGGVWNYALTDTADKLLAADATLIQAATSVSVTNNEAGTLTIANVTALLGRTTVDEWSYSLNDIARKLLAASTDITSSPKVTSVSVTGNAAGYLNVAEVTTLRGLTAEDDWTFALSDTAQNLYEASADIVGDAAFITVNGSVTVSQIVPITEKANVGAQLSYLLSDTRTHIENASDATVSGASFIVVTDTATIAQIAAIDARTDEGVRGNIVADTAAHIFTEAGVAYLGRNSEVTVTDAISFDQIGQAYLKLDNVFGPNTQLHYTAIADTARTLLDVNADAFDFGSKTVTVLGNVARDIAVEEVDILRGLTTNDSWTYSLMDTADALLDSANNTIFQAAISYAVWDASIADLKSVDLKTAKPVTAGFVVDSAAALFAGGTLSAYVVAGTSVEVTGAISIAQLQALRARVGEDDKLEIDDISDSAANLLAHLSAYQIAHPDDLEDFADATVTVTDAVTVEQANQLLPLMDNSDWEYRLKDTLANLQDPSAEDAVDDAMSYALTDAPAALVNLTQAQIDFVGEASNASDYDVLAPTLASVTGNGTKVVLTFSEAIQAGSGDIVIKSALNNSTVATIAVADATISGKSLSVTLQAALTADASYYVEVAAGAVKDAVGNAFAGIADATTAGFTGGTPFDVTPDLDLENTYHIGTGHGAVEVTWTYDSTTGDVNYTFKPKQGEAKTVKIDMVGTTFPLHLVVDSPLVLTGTAEALQEMMITGSGSVTVRGSDDYQELSIQTTGSNTIEAGAGTDWVTLGDGADKVVIKGGTPGTASDSIPTFYDTIMFFDLAHDTIALPTTDILQSGPHTLPNNGGSLDTVKVSFGVVTEFILYDGSGNLENKINAVLEVLGDNKAAVAFVHGTNTYVLYGDGEAGTQSSDIVVQLTGVVGVTSLGFSASSGTLVLA